MNSNEILNFGSDRITKLVQQINMINQRENSHGIDLEPNTYHCIVNIFKRRLLSHMHKVLSIDIIS